MAFLTGPASLRQERTLTLKEFVMLSQAVHDLRQRRQQIVQQTKQLETEARKLDRAIAILSELTGPAEKAAAVQPRKGRRKMSLLGRLRIKLGSLNRYGKKEEAKKLAAKIAELQAKAAQS